jgi:hypothetical protein
MIPDEVRGGRTSGTNAKSPTSKRIRIIEVHPNSIDVAQAERDSGSARGSTFGITGSLISVDGGA